jgi:aspartate racemase
LLDSVNVVQDKVDFIVLPCNTLHVFIEDLRRASKKPVVSIIDEVVNEVKSRGLKKVGLLAAMETFRSGLYESALAGNSVRVVKPSGQDRRRLSRIIHLVLKGVKSEALKTELVAMVGDMKRKGAEGVILGCTDLQLLLKQEDSSLRLIDAMEVLADSTVRMINGGEGSDGER